MQSENGNCRHREDEFISTSKTRTNQVSRVFTAFVG